MIAAAILIAFGIYRACGLAFAIPFALASVKRIDPHAAQGSWGFRLLIMPGIEFLEYITPPGGRDLPADTPSNDLVFWNARLTLGGLATLSARLHVTGMAFVS